MTSMSGPGARVIRAAGVVAAEVMGSALAIAVALGAFAWGAVDAVGVLWLLVGLSAVLILPAAFTGWLCVPRVVEPWRGRLGPQVMAGVTASTSTAVLVWAAIGLAMIAPSVTRGTVELRPISWELVLGSVLFVGVVTGPMLLASLVVTVPLGVAWVWVTRRLIQ